MEKWEEEGFASKEAYDKYQQTIKDLETKNQTLNTQVDEKQKVIDGNRSKISDLTEATKEVDTLKAEKEKVEEELAKLKDTKPDPKPTAEDIQKANDDRIAKLSPEQRKTFVEEYDKISPEQKEFLSKPEGMQAYLDLKLEDTPSANPFDVKAAPKAKDIKEQVNELFGKVDNQGAPRKEREGSGFTFNDLPDTAKKKHDNFSDDIEKQKQNLLG